MSIKNLEFSVSEEWKKIKKLNPWTSFVPEEAKDSEGNEYQRKKGNSLIYKRIGNDYVCVDCGSEILGVEVVHPIWNGTFPCSGYGKTAKEFIPYCPKCEKKPKYWGYLIEL